MDRINNNCTGNRGREEKPGTHDAMSVDKQDKGWTSTNDYTQSHPDILSMRALKTTHFWTFPSRELVLNPRSTHEEKWNHLNV